MKVLGVFNVKNRGTVFTCAPDRIITMETVKAGLAVRRGAKVWTVIGVERHCIESRVPDIVGLLVRGECDLAEGDEVELEAA